MTTYYVDATLGDDENNGTSTSTPWKTLAQVKTKTFSVGDFCLFKRGETWREQFLLDTGKATGAANSPVTFGAYGSGDKPIISGAADLSATGAWADQGSNIWRAGAGYGASPVALPTQVGNIIFNNEASIGVKRSSLVACVAQGDYYYHTTPTYRLGDYLEMYSVGNPGTFYTKIEACQWLGTSLPYSNTIGANSYFTLQNLDFRYAGYTNLSIVSCDHVVVEYCDFRFNGGCYDAVALRDGYDILFWTSGSNIQVRYNTFYETWASAVVVETLTASSWFTNVYIHHNQIVKAGIGLELWCNASGAGAQNVCFVHNVVYDTGAGLCAAQRNYAMGTTDMWVYNYGTYIGCIVKNNIFASPSATFHFYSYPSGLSFSGLDINYNCYYPGTGSTWHTSGADYTFANWKAFSGMDAHSIVTDPTITSATDYHLVVGSPAIDTGTEVNLGFPHLGTAPDMGIYEYGESGFLKLCPFKKA